MTSIKMNQLIIYKFNLHLLEPRLNFGGTDLDQTFHDVDLSLVIPLIYLEVEDFSLQKLMCIYTALISTVSTNYSLMI